MPGVVIVLPTYDEADNIGVVLRGVRSAVPDAELLVVDVGIPDGTGELAESLSAELGQISVLQRGRRGGLGNAYRAGFAAALERDADVVVLMDADQSHDPATLPLLVGRLGDPTDPAGLVIGSRYVPGGGIEEWSRYRRLLSRWGNRYAAWLLRVDVADCTSGFRAFSADALRAIRPETTRPDGYAFHIELIRRLIAADVPIREVPIRFVDRRRGRSKMSWRIVVESMWLVTRWGIADRRRARPDARSDGRRV